MEGGEAEGGGRRIYKGLLAGKGGGMEERAEGEVVQKRLKKTRRGMDGMKSKHREK